MAPKIEINWVTPAALQDVPSPAVVLGLDVIDANLSKMIEVTGGTARLRPHVKTHKMPQLVRRQMDLGIHKFKCATIAEAEMCARAGAPDVLLSYQLTGPNVARFAALQKKYPATRFSTVVDDAGALRALAAAKIEADILLDLDVGQQRTGIQPGPNAVALYRELAATKSLRPGGLHAYDGHLQMANDAERAAGCVAAMAPVFALRDELVKLGLPVPRVVAGGSPTFLHQAVRADVECSPGTAVLWDASSVVQEGLPFQCAAVLLTRVVSKPTADLLCLDLGHKAIASEMPHPRAFFSALPDAQAVKHSEEHLVLKTSLAGNFSVGDALLAVPWHICPCVALHAEAVIVEQGVVTGSWPVEARARKITV
jgi:D-threonine aldolase